MVQSKTWFFLLLCLTFVVNQQSFYCYEQWKSDGNYYDKSYCMQVCINANNFQNVSNVDQLSNQCCTPICDDQINYHLIKRTVIIVVVSVLLFMVLVCCVFGCCGPSIKNSFVMKEQEKLRKAVSGGISPEAFDIYATQFYNIFTQESRNDWQISFTVDGKRIMMQWFIFRMEKLKNYKYKMVIEGQDLFGLWRISGYYVNTSKGPTAWGLKNYENVENNTIYFQKQSDLVHELIRVQDGTYDGNWYNRSNIARTGICSIKHKGQKLISRQTIENFDIVSNEEHI